MAVFNCSTSEIEEIVEFTVTTETNDQDTGELSVTDSLTIMGDQGVSVAVEDDAVKISIDPETFPEELLGGSTGNIDGYTKIYDGKVTNTVGSGGDTAQGLLGRSLPLIYGQAYKVVFDGVEYDCPLAKDSKYGIIGNQSLASWYGEDTGEPFAIRNVTGDALVNTSAEYAGEHTLAIYSGVLPGVGYEDNGKILQVADGAAAWEEPKGGNANIIFAESEDKLPDPSTVAEGTMAFVESAGEPVLSVNGVTPDENGNVEIETGGDTTVLEQRVDDLEHLTSDIDDAVKELQENAPVALVGVSVTEAADGTVTMVNTLDDDTTETIVVGADEDGNPNSLTYNGVAIPLEWAVSE